MKKLYGGYIDLFADLDDDDNSELDTQKVIIKEKGVQPKKEQKGRDLSAKTKSDE